MTFRQTAELLAAQLAGVRDSLDVGTSNATIEIRTGAKPAAVTDAATGTLLATLILDKPCGTLSAAVLTLIANGDAVAVATGTAEWARWADGNGAVRADSDVSVIGGGAEVQLTTLSIEFGMVIPLVSATLSY